MARTPGSTLTVTLASGSQYTQTISDSDLIGKIIPNNVSSLAIATQDDAGANVTITLYQTEGAESGWTPV